MLGMIFYSALLGVLTFLALRKSHLALVGVLCMFGLEQLGQIYLPFLRTHGIFTNVYLIVLVLVAVALRYRSGTLLFVAKYKHSKIRWLSILLYAYAFLSLAWLLEGVRTNWSALWPYLILNTTLAPLLVSRINDLEEVLRTFIWLGGSIVLFLAIVPDWGARSPMIAGTDDVLGIPLSLAQMSGYLLIIAMMHFRKTYTSIGLLSIAVIGALVVAVQTGSRGQLIFSIVSFALVAPLVWQKFTLRNALQLLVASVCVVFTSLYIFYQAGAYTSRWQPGEMAGDFATRLGHAKILLVEWFNTPYAIVFGLGNSASNSSDLVGGYPHVVPLEILGEEGLIGFTLFLLIVLYSVGQARRFRALTFLSKDVKRVYAATFACFLFTLMLSFKQGSLLNSSVIFLFAVISERYFYLVMQSLRLLNGVQKHYESGALGKAIQA